MHNVHTFSRRNEKRERRRKRKRGECDFSMEEASGPPLLQNFPLWLTLGGTLWRKERAISNPLKV
jgi:hypothetical protein